MTLFTNIQLLKNYEIVDAIVRKVQTGDQQYLFNNLGDDLYSAMAEIYSRGYKEALSQVKLDMPDYRVGVKGGLSWYSVGQIASSENVEAVKAPRKAQDAGRGRKTTQVAHDVVS